MPRIQFKTVTNGTFHVELADDDTVSRILCECLNIFSFQFATVKQKIAKEKGTEEYPVEAQKLIFNGKVLEDTKTVKQMQITEDKFIVITVVKVWKQNLLYKKIRSQRLEQTRRQNLLCHRQQLTRKRRMEKAKLKGMQPRPRIKRVE